MPLSTSNYEEDAESIFKSQNQTLAMELFSELQAVCNNKNNSSNQEKTAATSTNEQKLTLKNLRTNFSKFSNKLMENLGKKSIPQNQTTQIASQASENTLKFISEKPMLAFYDTAMPFISVFFEEREESGEDMEVIRFYALQQNGMLSSFRFDENTSLWVKSGSKNILLNQYNTFIQHAAYIPSIKVITWAQVDTTTGCGNIYFREVKFDNPLDLTLGPLVKVCEFGTHANQHASASSTSPTSSNYYSTLVYRNIGQSIWDIEPSKTGIWVFTSNRIMHIDFSQAVKATTIDPSKHFLVSTMFARNIYAFIEKVIREEQANTSTEAVKGTQVAQLNQSKRSDIRNSKEFFYCSKYVHPLTKQLVLLGVDGIVRISNLASPASIIIDLKVLNPMQTGIEDYINKFNSLINHKTLKDAVKCQELNPVEIFFAQQTVLCITNQDICMVYEPRLGILLSQMQLPTDVILEEGGSIAEKKSIIWNVFGSDMRSGVFCSSQIFELNTPPVAEILRMTFELREEARKKQHLQISKGIAQSTDRISDLHALSRTAGEWGLHEWRAKLLVELIVEDAQDAGATSRMSYKEKQNVMKDLCEILENPALVWTSTRSLSEQQAVIESISKFLQHFPSPDSTFWNREKQKQLSTQQQNKFGKANERSWQNMLTDISRQAHSQQNSVTPKQFFSKFTPLNLSVFPSMAESLAKAQEQLDNLGEYNKQYTPVTPTPETPLDEEDEFIDDIADLTDIELDALSHEKPQALLSALSSFCGLEELLQLGYKSNQVDIFNEESFLEKHSEIIEGICISMNPVIVENDDEFHLLSDPLHEQQLYQNNKELSLLLSPEYHSASDVSFSSFATSPESSVTQSATNLSGALYFSTLSKLLFERADGKFAWTLCLLIAAIEKIKKDQYEKELNELQAKGTVTIFDNHKNLQLRLKKTIDFKKIYAQKVLSHIHPLFVVDKHNTFVSLAKSLDTDFDGLKKLSAEQSRFVAKLLIWSGDAVSAIRLLIAKDMLLDIVAVVKIIFPAPLLEQQKQQKQKQRASYPSYASTPASPTSESSGVSISNILLESSALAPAPNNSASPYTTAELQEIANLLLTYLFSTSSSSSTKQQGTTGTASSQQTLLETILSLLSDSSSSFEILALYEQVKRSQQQINSTESSPSLASSAPTNAIPISKNSIFAKPGETSVGTLAAVLLKTWQK